MEVRPDFGPVAIGLSVSEDGIGRPGDYDDRGRGFSGTEADARRMGGRFVVESGEQERERPSPVWSRLCLQPKEEAKMSSTNKIRVMLVDDHPITRKGLNEILENEGGFEVVAEAADGEEAVARADELRPDVIVMDVMMPKKDGVDACRDILDLFPDTKVLMLTASTEDDAVIEGIAAGASGFLQKYTGSDELLDAIRTVAQGNLMIPEESVHRVFSLIRSGAHMMPSSKVLSKREREVLAHFSRGKSYAGIAEDLGIGTMTVRNTIYRVQDKLGVESKQEIVVWAVQNGLLEGEEG